MEMLKLNASIEIVIKDNKRIDYFDKSLLNLKRIILL